MGTFAAFQMNMQNLRSSRGTRFTPIFIFFAAASLLGCGNGQTLQVASTQKTIGRDSSTGLQISAETQYSRMSTTEYAIQFSDLNGNPYIGSATTQRSQNNPAVFCRKTGAVVPNPVYKYECWEYIGSDSTAEKAFISLSASSHYYANAIGIYGSGTEETVNSDGSELCQKITPVVPNPVSSYQCFERLD